MRTKGERKIRVITTYFDSYIVVNIEDIVIDAGNILKRFLGCPSSHVYHEFSGRGVLRKWK